MSDIKGTLENDYTRFTLDYSAKELKGYDRIGRTRPMCYNSSDTNLLTAWGLLMNRWNDSISMNEAINLIGVFCPMNKTSIF